MPGLVIREATPADLPQIIQLMSNDALGSIREEYAVRCQSVIQTHLTELPTIQTTFYWLRATANMSLGTCK